MATQEQNADTRTSDRLPVVGVGVLDLEALAAFDQATSFAPDEPDAWYNKAIVLERLTRTEEALSCQARATRLKQQTI